MITALLIAFPFLAALLMLIIPAQRVKQMALAATLIQAAATAWVIYSFDLYEKQSLLANMQFILREQWIPGFGISFFVGIDGISLLMLILTNFLLPFIVLSTWNRESDRPGLFYFLILFMQSALVGVFVSLDAFLYYIFWELALIPIYFIVLLWGGENRVKITFKFFIYTLLGSLLMLAGIIWMYLHTYERSFGIDAFYETVMDLNTQRWIFWAFFIAYAIKIPVLPFHSWQPDTYTTAPTAGTMLLSGIMLKMGIYSIFRWVLPVTPLAVAAYTDVILIMCIAGVVYASWIAIGQKDLKRMFAWSSIAHVGMITAGIFTLSQTGFQGALIQMLAHGVNAVALFFVAEIFLRRRGTTMIDELGGIRAKAPVFASVFMIITFASIALPLTNSFIGEFLILSSLYEYSWLFSAIAGLSVILGAVYMLRGYKNTVLGKESETGFADLNAAEKWVFIPLAGIIVFFGIFPQFIFNLTDESVKYLLEQISNHMAMNY